MKVGISTTAYEWHLTGGRRDGIGVYTGNLLSSLKKIDDVDVCRFYYPPSIASALTTKPEVESIQLRMPYPVSGFFSHVLNLPDINNRIIKRNVDIFHCTDYKIPKLNTVPVVATMYDAIPLKNPEWASGRFRSLKNLVLKKSAHWADHVITISDFVVGDVVEYWGVPEDKVSVVHCGVDAYWFQKQSEDTVKNVKHKYHIDRSYVLFVGTFQPRKNIDGVIDAFLSLPESYRKEFKLILVGKSGWGSEELIARINGLADKGECIRVENATDDDLRCLYQGASVFLFPSFYEGFGLPILEAFASGVPVITSRGTALEEIAGDAAVLVDPYSPDEMSSGLHELLHADEASIEAMRTKGLERASMFGWDKAAESIYQIYKNLI